jgi:hypothetical protein
MALLVRVALFFIFILGAQLTVMVGGFHLSGLLFLGLLLVVYVFFVYISLRDHGRQPRINQSITQSPKDCLRLTTSLA